MKLLLRGLALGLVVGGIVAASVAEELGRYGVPIALLVVGVALVWALWEARSNG